MIDVSKCTIEDSYYDGECKCYVYYFNHPVALNEARFDIDPEDNVVSMCIQLNIYDDGGFDIFMSPTIEEDDGYTDVDWCTLRRGVNYTIEDAAMLYSMAKDYDDFISVANVILEDDGSSTGGTAFVGETVRDFIRSVDKEFYSLEQLNDALKECGIKPVSPQ